MEITNPVLIFAFIMFIILLAPVIFTRLRLPGIVGLIFSGIIIGPHALGIIKADASLELFSSVGLIYIMFLAGLEINLNEFNRQRKQSITFGALTFLFPMIIGTFGARYLFSYSWTTSLLLASMFASHTLIPYPIISRLNLNKERSVIATVGGTIFTDTAALLILAVIAEKVTSDLSAIFWVRQGFLLIALVWFALWLLPRIAYSFFKILTPDGGSEFILTLGLVFFTAYCAHLAGVEPIIGAFFAGLSLSRLIADQSPLKNRLEFVGNALFIPFFLISVGMLVNLQVMFSQWAVWKISLFMIACGVVSKFLAATVFAKLLRYSSDERYLIFGLSVNQAAATLAAVIVGLRLEIFADSVLNGTILMIFVTCVIGPWFTEKYGQRLARATLKAVSVSPQADEKIMVVVSQDDSAELLTDVALSVRKSDSKEALIPLYVIQEGIDVDQKISQGEKLLGRAVARIVSADVPVSPVSRIDINISGGILRSLKQYQASVMVLGAVPRRGANLRAFFFDVSDKVCEESEQLVFLSQLSGPLNIGKSVYLFIPPMMEVQKGFNRAMESITNLAVANKLALQIVSMPETIEQAKKILRKKTALEVSFSVLEKWRDISAWLQKSDIGEADSILVMAVRKGRLGWQPSVRRLFYSLGAEYPSNNIFLVYPGDSFTERSASEKDPQSSDSQQSLLSHPAIVINTQSLEEAVGQVLGTFFLDDPDRVGEVMHNLSPLDPVALSPEVILFHTHSQYVSEPIILLATVPDTIVFPALKKKIKAFFILVSPRDRTDVHLQALTKVAQIARGLETRPDPTRASEENS
jgi:Kef-type K+ transport system membrane component KefB/mannitol/fructose-specific phosphotransferase system IIA component (Ntr-type)